MLTERNLGVLERYGLIRMNVFYTDMVIKLLLDHKEPVWTPEQLESLRSEISGLKTAGDRTFARHCWSGLFTLQTQILDHVVEAFERFGTFHLQMRRHLSISMCSYSSLRA